MKKVILPLIIFCFLINCPHPVQEAFLGEITTDPVTTSVSYRESIALSITTENIDEAMAVFTWSADSGTFNNPNRKNTVWTAPVETGTVTIRVYVLGEGMKSALTKTLQMEVTSPPLFSFRIDVDSGSTGSGAIAGDSTAGGSYVQNTAILAKAAPDTGSLFTGWYDAPSGGTLVSQDNPYSFTLVADTALYARFELQFFSFHLAVDSNSMGSGEIAYASTRGGSYEYNTAIIAQASPYPGNLFTGWYDAPSGGTLVSWNNPYNFSLAADTALYARFGYPAGYEQTCTVADVEFNLNYCPGGTFPTGIADDGEASVTAFWIAETEVTYELWQTVYDWAVDPQNGYSFANTGTMGDGTGDTNQHPVTNINWRDAMVWTNALTEYYNEQTGQSLECVYLSDLNSPIKNSTDANGTQCDTVTPDPDANGFRLPTHPEWECAARWQGADDSYGALERGGDYWTPGSYASGAAADYNDATATQAAAWYLDNSGGSTHVVGQKPSGGNALGLYDMSGNVWEWSFTPSGSIRMYLGSAWNGYADYLRVGSWSGVGPNRVGSGLGFRPVRTP